MATPNVGLPNNPLALMTNPRVERWIRNAFDDAIRVNGEGVAVAQILDYILSKLGSGTPINHFLNIPKYSNHDEAISNGLVSNQGFRAADGSMGVPVGTLIILP